MEIYIGYIAAILTTISFVPQAIRVVTTKKTQDISRNTYILLNIGIIFWLIYGFIKIDIPITLANIITLIFSITILIYKLKED